MKQRTTEEPINLIAIFGQAHLIWRPTLRGGRHELIGGSPADRQAALDWCSLFHHDLVFSVVTLIGQQNVIVE